MNSETLSLTSTLRLELTMQVEKRVREECAEEKASLQNEIKSLKKQLEESASNSETEKALAQSQAKIKDLEKCIQSLANEKQQASDVISRLNDTTIPSSEHESLMANLAKKNDELSLQVKQFKKSFYEGKNDSKQLKSELDELRSLDPKGLKKKLEETKKKLKEKTTANAQLTSDRSKYKETATKQARDLKAFREMTQALKADYLYESEDKTIQVLSTVFQSDSHPFVLPELNFRVINQENGTSYIVQYIDGSVCFSEDFDCPEDVLIYLQERIEMANQD